MILELVTNTDFTYIVFKRKTIWLIQDYCGVLFFLVFVFFPQIKTDHFGGLNSKILLQKTLQSLLSLDYIQVIVWGQKCHFIKKVNQCISET